MSGLRRRLLAVGLPVLLLACSAADEGGGDGSGGASSGSGGAGGLDIGVGGQGAGTALPAEVFAHSSSRLYKLDPITKQVTSVGLFSGCTSEVTDLAINEDGDMYATAFGSLYRIDKETASCSLIASGTYPNSLSFVPKGTLDAGEEALVGYVDDAYVRIDKVSGSVTQIGTLGNGKYISSGDIVSVIGGGAYLTVTGFDCNDCLVEVNPSTGAMVQVVANLVRPDIFGLAFWGGSAYGFTNDGGLFEIVLSTGVTFDIPIPDAPSGLSFWGAGSTTAAPLTPPE